MLDYNEKEELLLEIKELYNHILDEIIQLNNYYGYKTPLEIFCLFNKLNDVFCDYGELFNQLYIKGFENICCELETNDTRGIQVLLDGGVCRHRATMLCDIYRKMNIDSVVLSGYVETLLSFHYGNSQNKQIADRIYVTNILKKISDGAKLTNFKSQLKKRKISYQLRDVHDDYFLSKPKFSNHAIVMVGDDKRNYLDPMNNTTFYKNDNDIITLRNNLGQYFFFVFKVHKFFFNFDNENFDEIYGRILDKPGANEFDTDRKLKEIYSYLNNNKKGLEEFTKSNEECIEHIKGKCLSLRQH